MKEIINSVFSGPSFFGGRRAAGMVSLGNSEFPFFPFFRFLLTFFIGTNILYTFLKKRKKRKKRKCLYKNIFSFYYLMFKKLYLLRFKHYFSP